MLESEIFSSVFFFFFINACDFTVTELRFLIRSHFHHGYTHLKKSLPTKRKTLKSQDNTAKAKEHMWRVYSLAKLKLIQPVLFVIVTSQQKTLRCKDVLYLLTSSGIKSEMPCQPSPISVEVATIHNYKIDEFKGSF